MHKIITWKAAALGALVLALATVPALAAPGAANADTNKLLAEVRQATTQYHDPAVAEADGFFNTEVCVAVPGLGGMGVHFVNVARIMDGTVDELQPDVLLYAPGEDGLELVAVEYMMPALVEVDGALEPWFEETAPEQGFANPSPTLFGDVTFHGPMPGHGPGEPWHYDLHVWTWRANPDGVFSSWNPNVTCA